MNHSWIRLFGLRTSRILFLEDILPWTLGKESLLIMKMTRSFSICDREQISQSSSITATFSFWTQTSSPFQRSSKMCQAPWEVIIGILLWLSDLSWTIQTTPATKVDFDLLAAHNHPTTGPSSNFEGCVKYKLSFEVGWDLFHPSFSMVWTHRWSASCPGIPPRGVTMRPAVQSNSTGWSCHIQSLNLNI